MRSDDAPAGQYIFGIVLLLFAMWFGVRFPDVDQSLLWLKPIILHRSILTHGLLLPLFFYIQYKASAKTGAKDNPIARLGIMGLCIGLCAHLAFDLYSNRWWGFAQIYVPLYGRLPTLLSQAWIAGSVFIGLFWCCRLLRKTQDLFLGLTTALVAFVLSAQSNSTATALAAFLTLGVLGFAAFLIHAKTSPTSAPKF